MKALIFFLILIPQAGMSAVPWEKIYSELPVPVKGSEGVADQSAPLYRSLQLQYRTQGTDNVEAGGAGRTTVKVDLLAWGQRKKEKDLIEAYSQFGKVVERETSSESCLYRGHLFLHAFFLSRAIRLEEKLLENYRQQKQLLKRGIGANLYEFNDLLSVEDAELGQNVSLSEKMAAAASVEKMLPVKLSEIDFRNFLRVEFIRDRGLVTEPRTIELQKLRSLAKIHQLEYQIEEKKGNQVLDSVELYRWNEQNNGGISYGVQFSFNLPFFNKKNTAKESVERLVAMNKLARTERELISDLDGTKPGLEEKLLRYETLRSSDYLKTMKNLIRVLRGNRNTSPILILKTKAKILKERLARLELRRSIAFDYLDGVFHSGQLSQCSTPAHLGGQ